MIIIRTEQHEQDVLLLQRLRARWGLSQEATIWRAIREAFEREPARSGWQPGVAAQRTRRDAERT